MNISQLIVKYFLIDIYYYYREEIFFLFFFSRKFGFGLFALFELGLLISAGPISGDGDGGDDNGDEGEAERMGRE